MDESQIAESREFSTYGSPVSSLKEVVELQSDESPNTIASIRIMHSMNLKSMQGVEKFTKLVELNLSSNSIERMECLHSLTQLQILNLSCNRIRVINCLNTLTKLEKLILASNRIQSLQNLNQLEGSEYSLRVLDIKDNKLTSLAELSYLNCLPKLQEVYVTMEDEANPIFRDTATYANVISKLSIASNLQKIDGKPASAFYSLLERLPEKQGRPTQKLRNIPAEDDKEIDQASNDGYDTAPRRQNKTNVQDSPPQTSKKEADTRTRVLDAQKEQAYSQEITTLEKKLQNLLLDHKELLYKFEYNDNFWNSKCQKLEQELLELSKDNKNYQDKNAKLHNTLTSKNQELDDMSNTIAALKAKKDRKEDMIDSLQNRVGDIMKENGECHKELSMRLEEISRLKENLMDAESRIGELKAVIRENEKNLTEIHTRAIENSNLNILRSEELQRKYEGLHKTYEEKCKENQSLGEKNKELVDLVREWEAKFSNKLNEVEVKKNENIVQVESEFMKKIDEINDKHRKEIKKQEHKFKENMDLLEEEFKKVLMENNERYRNIKLAFEEKTKSENEIREFMKITVAKTTEQERLIEEQNEILRRLKNEFTNALQEKDELSRLLSDKSNTIKTSVNTYRDDIERLQKEKELSQKISKDLEEELAAKTRELAAFRRKLLELEAQTEDQERVIKKLNDKIKDKDQRANHEFQELAQELEDLRDTINTKNRMLEDKNAAIEHLKDQVTAKEIEVENVKKQSESKNLEDDLHKEQRTNEKLRNKLDKLEEYVAELEETANNLREELNMKDPELEKLRKQLSDNNRIVSAFETELQAVIQQQQQEAKRYKDKDRRTQELEELLEDCKETLLKKSDRMRLLEDQLRARDSDFEKVLKSKDRDLENLRKKNLRNEEEMKVLVLEIERQKALAKENIEKLHQIFK